MRAVNLIPVEQRAGGSVGAGRSGGAVYVLLGTVACLALMALLYGIAHHQASNRTGEVATLQERTQQAQAAATQLAPYTSFVTLRQQRQQAVETLIDSRFDWAHVMHEFGRVLPAGVSVTSLSGTVGSATGTGGAASSSATPAAPSSSASSSSSSSSSSSTSSTPSASSAAVSSATPPGSVPSFSLAGCAVSQASVAQTIARLRLVDGVSAVTLQSSTKSGAGAGGGGGGCGAGDATYAIVVSFQPLPSGTATAASTVPAATTGGAR